MDCPHCQGFLQVEEYAWGQPPEVRCVNCGWRPTRTPKNKHAYEKVVRYRAKNRAAGKCLRCGHVATNGILCDAHRLKERRVNRLRMRLKAGHHPWQRGGKGRPPIEDRAAGEGRR